MLTDIETVYVKDRHITQNIRVVQYAIEYTKQTNTKNIIIFKFWA